MSAALTFADLCYDVREAARSHAQAEARATAATVAARESWEALQLARRKLSDYVEREVAA